jgi:hypothetical protein
MAYEMNERAVALGDAVTWLIEAAIQAHRDLKCTCDFEHKCTGDKEFNIGANEPCLRCKAGIALVKAGVIKGFTLNRRARSDMYRLYG